MTLLRIRYKPGLVKMIVSGSLGAAFHVLIDGIYHFDVLAFWPNKTSLRRLTSHIEKENIETICLCFFLAVVVLYIHAVISFQKDERTRNNENTE